ncbi:MAG TPA: GDP-L-fucose synthase [Sporichthyaceae bacterium]|nr:GDP-L-fucose synthase [Sporichthyaceae bacterium]
MISREAVVHVAGHRGLVGSAIWRHLVAAGFSNLVGAYSSELDLRDHQSVESWYQRIRPEYVVLAAARVGGILANSARPAEFLSDNLRIQVNVMDAAARLGVRKLLFLGSSCIYPKNALQPIAEECLLTGPLEETNSAYALAKIAGLQHVQALRKQYALPYISAMPTNLYGPGDNFDPISSHVLPGMIRKFHDAATNGADRITLWGTGTPRREFLHVDDLARACLVLLDDYDGDLAINIGVGADLTIAELAQEVGRVVGWRGEIEWDADKPDGTPRKLLDVRRIEQLGWKPEISLPDGLESTYRWFLGNVA